MGERFPDFKVDIADLGLHHPWKDIIFSKKNKPLIDKINKFLSFCLNIKDGQIDIFPYPDLLWSAFNHVTMDQLTVCIIGQDPYHSFETHNDKKFPQAMGMSFSIPEWISIPSSLTNIFKNQNKFKQQFFKPSQGDLSFWAY